MNPQNKQRGLVRLRSLWILGGVLLLLISIAYFFYGLQPAHADMGSTNNSNVRGEQVTEFTITKSESFRSIAARLSQESLIRSIIVFKWYALLTGRAQKFQPGVYTLSRAMSVPEITKILTSRGNNIIAVTIPEGTTVRDINALLVDTGVLAENDKPLIEFDPQLFDESRLYLQGLATIEGFLFPDTYRFEIGSTPEIVLETFLDNFEKKAWPLIKEEDNWYETLILASLLEREVPQFKDRQLVAGVLLKRIKIGMPLQVDATVSYARCEGLIKGCSRAIITKADLAFQSSFNTYLAAGWPPSPIANPGIAALQAALTPTASPYLYYLSTKDTKETLFSKTLDEHNNKRARHL